MWHFKIVDSRPRNSQILLRIPVYDFLKMGTISTHSKEHTTRPVQDVSSQEQTTFNL